MIINYGNVFDPLTWMLAGGTTLWLCVHPPRRASVILAAGATAALAGLIQGISIFLAGGYPKRESNPFVLSELAQSWRVPEAALLKLLAASSDKQVYCKVAWSNRAQGPLLAELYRQQPGDCDYNVALNANTQPEILTALPRAKRTTFAGPWRPIHRRPRPSFRTWRTSPTPN